MDDEEIPADDWDTYWKHFWDLLDPAPPPSQWQVVPGCEGVAALLKERGCQRVLEAASGIGLKALTFSRLGFEVTGMDVSATAIELSVRLSRAVNIPAEFIQLSWQNAPGNLQGRFDAVFNDAVQNSCDPAELEAACRCAFAALRPGGVFLFGGREKEEWELNPKEILQARWKKGESCGIAWTKSVGNENRTTLFVKQLYREAIYHRFLHLSDADGKRTLEVSGFRESMRWTWQDFQYALAKIGFANMTKVPVAHGPRVLHLCLASKP